MSFNFFRNLKMVRKERLELSRVAPLAPKASASTNSATFALTFPHQRLHRNTNSATEY